MNYGRAKAKHEPYRIFDATGSPAFQVFQLSHLLELYFNIGAYNTFRVAKFSIW